MCAERAPAMPLDGWFCRRNFSFHRFPRFAFVRWMLCIFDSNIVRMHVAWSDLEANYRWHFMGNTELHYREENIELKCGEAETGREENNNFNDMPFGKMLKYSYHSLYRRCEPRTQVLIEEHRSNIDGTSGSAFLNCRKWGTLALQSRTQF